MMARGGAALLGLLALAACCSFHEQSATGPSGWDAFAAARANENNFSASTRPKPEPIENEKTRQAHTVVQQRMHGVMLEEHPLVSFTPIEDPSGVALEGFHTALRRLERGEDEDGKVRIAIYGSSSVSADRYTAYLRGYLQHRFGDGGVGFFALAPLTRWHRHNEVNTSATRSWTIEHAQKYDGRLDGNYGLLGASASSSTRRANIKVHGTRSPHSDPRRNHKLELFYLQQPNGGRLRVKTAGRNHKPISTASDTIAPGYFVHEGKRSLLPIELRVVGDGEVRLFGAALERANDGIVVDTLGIGGTRAANMLGWNETVWMDNIARRSPDLYVLAYGANEAVDESEPIALYRANLEAVLDRFAAAVPDASCVLIGPVDFPFRDEQGAWTPRPRIDAIIDAQREIATRKGCGFWDTRAFMGGRGTMDGWATADPPLAKSDHLHLSTLGYFYLGRTFTDALMLEFDRPS